MMIAELDLWADLRGWGRQRQDALAKFLRPYTVIESDRELCRGWARLRAEAQSQGRKIETADAWIAATALLYQVPLVMHNRTHFDWITRLTVISETS